MTPGHADFHLAAAAADRVVRTVNNPETAALHLKGHTLVRYAAAWDLHVVHVKDPEFVTWLHSDERGLTLSDMLMNGKVPDDRPAHVRLALDVHRILTASVPLLGLWDALTGPSMRLALDNSCALVLDWAQAHERH